MSKRPRDSSGIKLRDGDVVMWRDGRYEVHESDGRWWLVDLKGSEHYPMPDAEEIDLRERNGD